MSTQEIINPNHVEKEPLSEEIKIKTMDEKCCVECKTTKTPLWRSGPAGPKSLCNACGIRQRKKRVVIDPVDSDKGEGKKKKDFKEESSSMRKKKRRVCVRNAKERKLCADLRRRYMVLGEEVVILQRQRSPVRRQRSSISSGSSNQNLGEVEQAALLLMAMSCGSVFA